MAEFVLNPRRAPRAPVRCRAEIVGSDGERWTTETEDVGPRGCQVLGSRRRAAGEPLVLQISAEGLARTLRVGGKVAWVSPAEPWRLGVAFAEQDAAVAADWFEALVARNPALAAYRGVPDRLSVDATLFLGAPPKLVMDFTNDEILVLRCIGSGVSVGEIRTRLKDSWARAQHALFSLIVRRHLVLARGAAVLPAAWKQILSDLEASLAVEDMVRSAPGAPPPRAEPPPAATPPPPAPPHPEPRAPPREPPTPAVYAQVRPLPATPPMPVRHESRGATRALDSGGWGGGGGGGGGGGPRDARHDFKGAGVGWRSQPRPRSPEADEMFRQAQKESDAGKVDAAIGLLRQALQLSPGDPEIAALLGRLAFRDRAPPQKK